MKIAVLVPRRSDGGRRDELWRYVRTRWTGWDVIEGHDDAEVFNRSRAINRAARAAGRWDVAVIADSDSFASLSQVEAAVTACATDGRMWLAYDSFQYVGPWMSDQILAGYDGDWSPGVEWAIGGTCSSMVVVRRDVWDQAHGFDEGFAGWGSEDVAAMHAFSTFGGGLARIPGPVWHLWHPASTERSPEQDDRHYRRAQRYQAAAGDRAAMTALIEELARDTRSPDSDRTG